MERHRSQPGVCKLHFQEILVAKQALVDRLGIFDVRHWLVNQHFLHQFFGRGNEEDLLGRHFLFALEDQALVREVQDALRILVARLVPARRYGHHQVLTLPQPELGLAKLGQPPVNGIQARGEGRGSALDIGVAGLQGIFNIVQLAQQGIDLRGGAAQPGSGHVWVAQHRVQPRNLGAQPPQAALESRCLLGDVVQHLVADWLPAVHRLVSHLIQVLLVHIAIAAGALQQAQCMAER